MAIEGGREGGGGGGGDRGRQEFYVLSDGDSFGGGEGDWSVVVVL